MIDSPGILLHIAVSKYVLSSNVFFQASNVSCVSVILCQVLSSDVYIVEEAARSPAASHRKH